MNHPSLPLLRPPIVLENDAWLMADAFVGPGVRLREGAMLGARASAFRDLEPWGVYVGNPARRIKDRPRV
jgi:putative colanic acid biosynthesis acetyltransferase WcaF